MGKGSGRQRSFGLDTQQRDRNKANWALDPLDSSKVQFYQYITVRQRTPLRHNRTHEKSSILSWFKTRSIAFLT